MADSTYVIVIDPPSNRATLHRGDCVEVPPFGSRSSAYRIVFEDRAKADVGLRHLSIGARRDPGICHLCCNGTGG